MHVPTDPPPTPSAIATIGVYGFAGNSFLERLSAADVRLVLDVRQRRGVRGAQYAWANSRRLQDALAAASLGYRHHPELAPTTELRQLQYAEDARLGVGKRSRVALAPEYVGRYTTEVLDRVDLNALVTALPAEGLARAPLRRARPRGLSPLPHRRSFGRSPRFHDRAPAPLMSGAVDR